MLIGYGGYAVAIINQRYNQSTSLTINNKNTNTIKT